MSSFSQKMATAAIRIRRRRRSIYTARHLHRLAHARPSWERQYVEPGAPIPTASAAIGSWSVYRWGWQFSGSQALDEACVSFFGAFGAAWEDTMVARWSANTLGMLWPEPDASFIGSGGSGDPPTVARRPVVIIAAG